MGEGVKNPYWEKNYKHVTLHLRGRAYSQIIPSSSGKQHRGGRREQTTELKSYFDSSNKVQ